MWHQVILAASNGLGIFTLAKTRDEFCFWLTTLVMMASCGMHLSETKHGFHAIPPFTDSDAWVWLNFDRFCALLATAYFTLELYNRITAGDMTDDRLVAMLIVGFLGFSCMTVGELVVTDQTLYTLLHLVWHVAAYSIMQELA